MDIKEQDILGDAIDRHWYYRAKAAALRKMLGPAPVSHVLDVGAGSGFFSRKLLARGAAQATCVDPEYAAEHEEIHAGRPIKFVRTTAAGDFDLVLMMDVLEHVDDDVGLVREYAALVPPGARFLITVPAFQWMWSGHDVFLEHRRRYTLPQMQGVLDRAGLKILHGCYYYGLTFPLAAAQRFAGRVLGASQTGAKSQLQLHNPLINETLAAICLAEVPFFRANRVAGLTVFVLAQQPL